MFPPHKFTDFKSTEKTTTEVMVLYSLLINLCEIFQISDLNEKKIVAALENNVFSDFEDGLQEECAVESMADYIVTRNPADFKHSRVKVILPDELLRELEKKIIIRREYRTITSVVVFSVLLKAVNLRGGNIVERF